MYVRNVNPQRHHQWLAVDLILVVVNPEKSEIAQKLNLKEKGNFAIKTR